LGHAAQRRANSQIEEDCGSDEKMAALSSTPPEKTTIVREGSGGSRAGLKGRGNGQKKWESYGPARLKDLVLPFSSGAKKEKKEEKPGVAR